ncbi:MAG: helix-turn-helix domain-containing protein [Elusimicrobiota bacterium]|nr:helix-turn-helix domain-containing protein [Elusimicrobiota bacterium]
MLRLEMWITIKTLYERGKNKTQIAEILGISRKTVRRVLNKLEQGETEPKRKQVESILSQHDEYIRSKVAEELPAVRIFQDLVTEKEYTGS